MLFLVIWHFPQVLKLEFLVNDRDDLHRPESFILNYYHDDDDDDVHMYAPDIGHRGEREGTIANSLRTHMSCQLCMYTCVPTPRSTGGGGIPLGG